ncbi:polyphosphate kinase 1 [soil metagenome]
MSQRKRASIDFHDSQYFIDRELSWLKFNDRVVDEAAQETTPALERLRFLGIASSNLDEFFMVRVAGIQGQVQARIQQRNAAGLTPDEHFAAVHRHAHEQVDRQYQVLQKFVLPALAKEHIHIRELKDISRTQRKFVREYFDSEVFPVLTPLAVDSAHPFPHLRNLSLNLAVRLTPPRTEKRTPPLFAVVQVPAVIDRLVKIPSKHEGEYEFVLLEDLISDEIALLFPGMKIIEVCAFRLIRDADIDYDEEEADDLLKSMEEELRRRERGHAVRLGIERKASPDLVSLLLRTVGLDPMQVYPFDGPINLAEVAQIANHVDRNDLKYPPFSPSVRDPLRSEKNIFRAIARQDVLVHHPFESFSPVVEFIEQAAKDPNVLAIKQTLYRTSGDSAIIKALMNAAQNGKQVAALMELKARFDEERNIGWAKQMEKAGVHVVYGLVGLKTHAKLCLVVRKEQGGIRRYVHLGTGNYNPITARVYTDLGLFTCDPDLCDDASELFNLLTGYSRMPEWRKMSVAPIRMRETITELINGETEKARAGGVGRIRAKMNSLVDESIITLLYEASCAGVQIDLVVRGICCLRPGIPNVSENIRVSSIVDRFLEHTRLFIFGEGETERVFLASADWMPRNLDRRVECLFPIEQAALRRRVVDEIFTLCTSDNVKRSTLKSDGTYARVTRKPEEPAVRSQLALLALEESLRGETRMYQPIASDLFETATPNGGNGAAETIIPLRPIKPTGRGLKIPANGAIREIHNLPPPGSEPIPAPVLIPAAPAAAPAPEPPKKARKKSSKKKK